jgi:hypothetical protein
VVVEAALAAVAQAVIAHLLELLAATVPQNHR